MLSDDFGVKVLPLILSGQSLSSKENTDLVVDALWKIKHFYTLIRYESQKSYLIDFIKKMQVKELKRGQVLYEKGKSNEGLYVIIQGEFSLWEPKSQGEINGEIALITKIEKLQKQTTEEAKKKEQQAIVQLNFIRKKEDDDLLRKYKNYFLTENICALKRMRYLQMGDPLNEECVVSGAKTQYTSVAQKDSIVLYISAKEYLEIFDLEISKLNFLTEVLQKNFRNSKPDSIRRLTYKFKEEIFPYGSMIFHQDDPSNLLMIVKSGHIEISKIILKDEDLKQDENINQQDTGRKKKQDHITKKVDPKEKTEEKVAKNEKNEQKYKNKKKQPIEEDSALKEYQKYYGTEEGVANIEDEEDLFLEEMAKEREERNLEKGIGMQKKSHKSKKKQQSSVLEPMKYQKQKNVMKLGILSAGEVLGLDDFVKHRPRSYQAQSVAADTLVYYITKRKLDDVIDMNEDYSLKKAMKERGQQKNQFHSEQSQKINMIVQKQEVKQVEISASLHQVKKQFQQEGDITFKNVVSKLFQDRRNKIVDDYIRKEYNQSPMKIKNFQKELLVKDTDKDDNDDEKESENKQADDYSFFNTDINYAIGKNSTLEQIPELLQGQESTPAQINENQNMNYKSILNSPRNNSNLRNSPESKHRKSVGFLNLNDQKPHKKNSITGEIFLDLFSQKGKLLEDDKNKGQEDLQLSPLKLKNPLNKKILREILLENNSSYKANIELVPSETLPPPKLDKDLYEKNFSTIFPQEQSTQESQLSPRSKLISSPSQQQRQQLGPSLKPSHPPKNQINNKPSAPVVQESLSVMQARVLSEHFPETKYSADFINTHNSSNTSNNNNQPFSITELGSSQISKRNIKSRRQCHSETKLVRNYQTEAASLSLRQKILYKIQNNTIIAGRYKKYNAEDSKGFQETKKYVKRLKQSQKGIQEPVPNPLQDYKQERLENMTSFIQNAKNSSLSSSQFIQQLTEDHKQILPFEITEKLQNQSSETSNKAGNNDNNNSIINMHTQMTKEHNSTMHHHHNMSNNNSISNNNHNKTNILQDNSILSGISLNNQFNSLNNPHYKNQNNNSSQTIALNSNQIQPTGTQHSLKNSNINHSQSLVLEDESKPAGYPAIINTLSPQHFEFRNPFKYRSHHVSSSKDNVNNQANQCQSQTATPLTHQSGVCSPLIMPFQALSPPIALPSIHELSQVSQHSLADSVSPNHFLLQSNSRSNSKNVSRTYQRKSSVENNINNRSQNNSSQTRKLSSIFNNEILIQNESAFKKKQQKKESVQPSLATSASADKLQKSSIKPQISFSVKMSRKNIANKFSDLFSPSVQNIGSLNINFASNNNSININNNNNPNENPQPKNLGSSINGYLNKGHGKSALITPTRKSQTIASIQDRLNDPNQILFSVNQLDATAEIKQKKMLRQNKVYGKQQSLIQSRESVNKEVLPMLLNKEDTEISRDSQIARHQIQPKIFSDQNKKSNQILSQVLPASNKLNNSPKRHHKSKSVLSIAGQMSLQDLKFDM